MATYLLIMDAIIWTASIGACVSGLVALVGLLRPDQLMVQQAKRRRLHYRECLRRGRQVLPLPLVDQQMEGLVLAMNLRQNARRRVFLPARVQHQGTTAAIDCTVLDLSDTGARLAFGHSINLPGEIGLELAKTHQSVRAAVVWQRENTCGVHFIEGTLARPAGQELAPSHERQVA